MNIIGTVLERSEENQMYVQFKKLGVSPETEDYDWKVYILKKYFKVMLFINVYAIHLQNIYSKMLILNTNKKNAHNLSVFFVINLTYLLKSHRVNCDLSGMIRVLPARISLGLRKSLYFARSG